MYNYQYIRERINALLNHPINHQKEEEIRELQARFEITIALRTLANSFHASSIVTDSNIDISNILEGICKIYNHNQTGINETLQLLAGKRIELDQIMSGIIETLERLEAENIKGPEQPFTGFGHFTIAYALQPQHIKFEQLNSVATDILAQAGIIINKQVINQEKVNILAQAGIDEKMSETLTNLGIDLSEWDEESQERIQDAIYGIISPVSTLEKFTTVSPDSAFVPEQDPEAEKSKANCIRVVNLLSPDEQSKLANIINGSDEKGTAIEEKIREQLCLSQNYTRIKQIIDINDNAILLQIFGMCHMNQTHASGIEYFIPIKQLKHISSDTHLNNVTTNILAQAGIIRNKQVINQETVDILAQAGLDDNMSETLSNLGIDLSEWDEESQGRIQDEIFGRVFVVRSKYQTAPLTTFELEEEPTEIGEVMKRIVSLLTPKEKSVLINDTFDGKENIGEFLFSVQNASQIQAILSENEEPEEIMNLLAGGCYQSIANDFFNNLELEEKILLAQGKQIDIQCRSIKDKGARRVIIDTVKALCEEEMKTLSIDPFCDGLLKLLTKQQKIQIAYEGADIGDILNLEPNSYYQFMFDKLGASEIQNIIYPKCWEYLEEHKDDSLKQQYLLVPAKNILKNLGKDFMDGAKNILRAVTKSFRSKKETNSKIDEIPETTPPSRTVFSNALRTSFNPNPKITVTKDTPLREFLRKTKADVETFFSKAFELLKNLQEPDDFDDLDDGRYDDE